MGGFSSSISMSVLTIICVILLFVVVETVTMGTLGLQLPLGFSKLDNGETREEQRLGQVRALKGHLQEPFAQSPAPSPKPFSPLTSWR